MADSFGGGGGSTDSIGGGGNGLLGGNFNATSALDLGVLGAGAGALGYLLASGPAPLPQQFQQLEGNAAWEGQTGQALTTQGEGALAMAQRGELTPEQAAQLSLYKGGLQNTAAQTYASMGRNPNQDTSFVSTQANIDTQVNAMAQQQIQSTIALGLGEVQAGSGFTSQANQALISAGQAQLQQDQSYSSSLTSVFGAVAKLAPAVIAAL